LFENLSVYNLKGDLSNVTTFKTPLFSLVNTFNMCFSMASSILHYWFNLPGMLAAADRGEEVVHGEVQLEQGALECGQLHHRLLQQCTDEATG
jgi:hypothetical protein